MIVFIFVLICWNYIFCYFAAAASNLTLQIIRPEERTLLRRVAEIYTTLQTKKWNGAASTELLEDSGKSSAVF